MPIDVFMIEKHDSHSVHSLGYHLIWTPKFRHAILEGPVEIELKQILAQTCQTYDWTLHELEIMPDHVHLFVQTNPTDSISNVVKTLKSISALHLFSKFPKLKQQKFWGTGLWSTGYFATTVGYITEDTVRKYIQSQKAKG